MPTPRLSSLHFPPWWTLCLKVEGGSTGLPDFPLRRPGSISTSPPYIPFKHWYTAPHRKFLFLPPWAGLIPFPIAPPFQQTSTRFFGGMNILLKINKGISKRLTITQGIKLTSNFLFSFQVRFAVSSSPLFWSLPFQYLHPPTCYTSTLAHFCLFFSPKVD